MDVGMGGNACAGIDAEDRQRLDTAAAKFVDAKGLIVMISDTIGHVISDAGGTVFDFVGEKFGIDFKGKVEEIVERALWQAQSISLIGLDNVSDSEPWG